MVLSPDKYIGIWRAFRMRIISKALPMLRKYGAKRKEERDSQFFTLLAIHVCGKVIGILCRDDKADARE